MTAAVSATPNPAAAPAATSSTANGADPTGALNFTQNFDTFLTLLTTQLKNQDPLSPMNTDQFTQQLVMFSEVEQQIKTNSQLSTMISAQTSGEAIAALPMIGRTIEYTGDQTVLQNGAAGFSYTLPTDAAAATIAIHDANGATVFSKTVDPTAGKHAFIWNGQTSGGVQLPDGGTFKLTVQAVDAKNTPIAATTTAVGAVSGVSVNNNVATFNVSGVQVPMNQLVNVINGSPAAATN
jgi:flagellar basal-body rod modification protein FlgD